MSRMYSRLSVVSVSLRGGVALCLIAAALLLASCPGTGASVGSLDAGNEQTYGGSSSSSSSNTSKSRSYGSGGSTTTTLSFDDIQGYVNSGSIEDLVSFFSDDPGESGSGAGTEVVAISAAGIGLPAGGTITLAITGNGQDYEETAGADADGMVYFLVPRQAVGARVTVSLVMKKADGTLICSGEKTQTITDGCDFSIELVDTAPAPAPMPADFVPVGGGLYVCIHEVTQEEYAAYCGYGGSSPNATEGMGPDYPAYYVSWYDALVYCNRRSMAENLTPCYTIGGSTDPAVWGSVPTSSNATWDAVTMDTSADGYRLPTEAEWLQAADDGHECSGADMANLDDVAWYSGNSGSKTHEVKTKAPNANGIYDTSGNVYEWCWDLYTSSIRVYRGGSWGFSAGNCAVSYRDHNSPNYRNSGLGFRLVRKAP